MDGQAKKGPMNDTTDMILNFAKEEIRDIVSLKVLSELLIEKGIITQAEYDDKFDLIKEREAEILSKGLLDRLMVSNHLDKLQ